MNDVLFFAKTYILTVKLFLLASEFCKEMLPFSNLFVLFDNSFTYVILRYFIIPFLSHCYYVSFFFTCLRLLLFSPPRPSLYKP